MPKGDYKKFKEAIQPHYEDNPYEEEKVINNN